LVLPLKNVKYKLEIVYICIFLSLLQVKIMKENKTIVQCPDYSIPFN